MAEAGARPLDREGMPSTLCPLHGLASNSDRSRHLPHLAQARSEVRQGVNKDERAELPALAFDDISEKPNESFIDLVGRMPVAAEVIGIGQVMERDTLANHIAEALAEDE